MSGKWINYNGGASTPAYRGTLWIYEDTWAMERKVLPHVVLRDDKKYHVYVTNHGSQGQPADVIFDSLDEAKAMAVWLAKFGADHEPA